MQKIDRTQQDEGRDRYLPVRCRFFITLLLALSWLVLCSWLSRYWVRDLADYVTLPVAIYLVAMIALVPGFMNMFLCVSLLFDRRPAHQPLDQYPPISILIAAYNEEETIVQTITSIEQQQYPGDWEALVIDDGSTDATIARLKALGCPAVRVIEAAHGGKSHALNIGLAAAQYELVITLDADSVLYHNSLRRIVERLLADPPQTAAVAGHILARNNRFNWVTRIQDWDYSLAIASIKRMQSLFQGTLVAQGAFSIFRKSVLQATGGWPDCIGEDIVLTWALLAHGYRVGMSEEAIAFTTVPQSYRQFFAQRCRWARGLLQAFKRCPGVLKTRRLSLLFIYWNLMFPSLDLVYVAIYLPGVIAACLGYYFVAGPMTLAVLPLSILNCLIMLVCQRRTLHARGIYLRRNIGGFLLYFFFYGLLMLPACLVGYYRELAHRKETWGTK